MKKARLLEFATCIAMLWIGAGQARGAEPFHFIVKGDLVSSYVSRGMYQTGPSFQPTLGLGVAGLDFTVWGSTDFNGKSATTGAAQKEIDITLKYHLPRNFAVWVTDYWWYSPNTSRFMSFADHTTGHRFEASGVTRCRWRNSRLRWHGTRSLRATTTTTTASAPGQVMFNWVTR